MFPQQPQQQFRNTNADVKLFYSAATWNKPPGVSQIYMMLIGGGGAGVTSAAGGGSGAVTTWWGSAQNVPDNLLVTPSTGDSVDTLIRYRGANGIGNVLLTASAAVLDAGGTAMTANQFTASGFFQSVAGQDGKSGNITPSATTFLSGGGNNTATVTANYGYTTVSHGTFLLQPIIVGLGSAGTVGGQPALGCGARAATGVRTSPGLVIIAAW